MRTLVLLSIAALVAGADLEAQGECAVDGAEAVSDLMDSTMFIWASIARCGHKGEQVKCEVNIASAIESVNSMINVILGAVNKCGNLHSAHKECGMAAGRLTKSVAGLTAASGGIAQKCTNGFKGTKHGLNWNHGAGAQCVVNLKSSAKSLFKAIKALMRVKKNCKDAESRACASNSLQIVAAFAGLGEFLAGTIGHCTNGNSDDVECAEQIESLVHHTAKVSENGVDLSKACEVQIAEIVPDLVEVQVPRLYSEENQMEAEQSSISSPNLLLGAFLPVTAIVSFVGGRFYANRRSETREVMSEHE